MLEHLLKYPTVAITLSSIWMTVIFIYLFSHIEIRFLKKKRYLMSYIFCVLYLYQLRKYYDLYVERMLYITDYNGNKIWEDPEVKGNELVAYYQDVDFYELDRYMPFYGSLLIALLVVIIASLLYEVLRSVIRLFYKSDKNWPPSL